MTAQIYHFICPQCDNLLLAAAQCDRCGWQRPAATAGLGEALADPLHLGRSVSGRPAQFQERVWYTAPPVQRQSAGALLSLQADGRVRLHELQELLPGPSLPVCHQPAGDGQRLYLALADYAVATQRPPKALLALEPLTGRLLPWSAQTESRELGPPLLHNGLLVVSGDSPAAVYAIDLAQARVRWRQPLAVDYNFAPVAGDEALALVSGALLDPAQALLWLAHDDGRILWQEPMTRDRAGRGLGQPVAGGDLLFAPATDGLRAYPLAGGELRWRYDDCRISSRGVATATPTYAGDLLLLPTAEPPLDGKPVYALHALECATGRRRWRFPIPPDGGHILVSPLVAGEVVVIGDRQGRLFALRLSDGELLWQAALPRRLAAVPAVVGEALWAPARDGELYRLRLHPAAAGPELPPEVYEGRGEWAMAAAAHALAQPPDLVAAGWALMKAGEPARAQICFEHAGDNAGRAEALAAQGQYLEAVALLPGDRRRTKADWLRAAGEHDQAGAEYEALELWALAGAEYEAAQRPLTAIEAYKQAGKEHEADVTRLAGQLEISVVDRLRDSLLGKFGWEWAVRRYEQEKRYSAAADILEQQAQKGDEPALWERALALRRQAGLAVDWNRIREICQQLGDGYWEQEVEACGELARLADKPADRNHWLRQAGALSAQHGGWPRAREYFHESGDRMKEAEALAGMDKLEEAGALMADVEQPYPRLAARYYRLAAEKAAALVPPAARDEKGARLFELAAYWYENSPGMQVRAEECHERADQCMNRARLVLDGSGTFDRDFVFDETTQIVVILRNAGAGPADNIKVVATGLALNKCDPPIPASSEIPVLPAQEITPVRLSLTPQVYSRDEDELWQFDLYISYRDRFTGELRMSNKFEISRHILPNKFKEMAKTGGEMHFHQYLAGSAHFEGDVGYFSSRPSLSERLAVLTATALPMKSERDEN